MEGRQFLAAAMDAGFGGVELTDADDETFPDAEPPMLSIGSGTCGVAEEASVEVDAEGLVHQSTACTDASS